MTVLPEGFGLVLDRSVRSFRDGTVLIGGHPGRLITLSLEGVVALSSLLDGRAITDASRQLGGRLVEAGMAHPRPLPDRAEATRAVTVVVPVHNRSAALERCLGSIGSDVPTVVVDDGSDDPDAVARICERHRVRLIRRAVNGGPAMARNQAIAEVDTELVAFVDSDCRVTDGWLSGLVWQFDDPAVAAVAPRVRPDRSGRGSNRPTLNGFADGHSALDMGDAPSEVAPDRAVRYVPAAALVARRRALIGGFDPDLRVGEDVDLVWRLHDEGWRVRYEPSVTVFHHEPSSWPQLLGRRFRYGTSAGPLAKRHPGRLVPLELRPWPTAAAVAWLTGRRRTGLATVAASAAVLARQVRHHGIPPSLTLRWSAEAAGWTGVGLGHAATMLAGPFLVVAALRGKRSVVAFLVLAPPAVEWWRRRPDVGPLRWSLASVADDVAYGAGVWTGCIRARTFGPLLPALRIKSGADEVRRLG